ncbi:MAG: hypothetical protein JJU12_08085 [Chlamydiales bacterium]|nr:hypothetical protein [Chlamydiales bacterium]
MLKINDRRQSHVETPKTSSIYVYEQSSHKETRFKQLRKAINCKKEYSSKIVCSEKSGA